MRSSLTIAGGSRPSCRVAALSFDDVFFRHGQEDPSPTNNCYTRVRIRLGDLGQGGKLQRLRRFLITTFAGAEGLLLILSALTLAIRGIPQPDCLIVLIGPGSDGKSLFLIDLLKTAFQEARAQAGPGVLQIPEEFRKNMRRHLAKLIIAFDEAMSRLGLQEAEVKAFLAGSGNDVRRLHESETATVSWPSAAKFWAMNYSDIPQLSTALDGDSWKRRFRVVKLSSTFVQDTNDMDVRERRFVSDDGLKQLAKDQEFAKLFWVHFILPFMSDNDDATCYKRIKYPGKQTQEDTMWFLQQLVNSSEMVVTGAKSDPPVPEKNRCKLQLLARIHSAVAESDRSALLYSWKVKSLPLLDGGRTQKRVQALKTLFEETQPWPSALFRHFEHVNRKTKEKSDAWEVAPKMAGNLLDLFAEFPELPGGSQIFLRAAI